MEMGGFPLHSMIPHVHRPHGSHDSTAHGNAQPYTNPKAATAERRAAEKFAQMIDGRTFDPAAFAYFLDKQTSETQFQMLDILINLVSIWGNYYASGQATPAMGRGYDMYRWAWECSQLDPPLGRR